MAFGVAKIYSITPFRRYQSAVARKASSEGVSARERLLAFHLIPRLELA